MDASNPFPAAQRARRGFAWQTRPTPPLTVLADEPDFGRWPETAPLITIGIPAYNRPELLRETLASLRAQRTFTDFEVVVSDDLHLPETRQAVERSGLPRIRLHLNPARQGAVANWNRCIQLAAGRWVMVLHEDDTLYPWYFEHVVPRLRPEVAAVAVRCVQGPTPPAVPEPPVAYPINPYPPLFFLKSAMTPFPGVLFPRELALELGGFDAAMGPLADYDFWYRLACTGPVETLRVTGAFYRVGGEQWTSTAWPDMLRKMHLLRLRIAGEQLAHRPRWGRWLARFFTFRAARSYRGRFTQRPAVLSRTERFGIWWVRAAPSGWIWAGLRRLASGKS